MTDHACISYIKSTIRIAGYSALFCITAHPMILVAAAVLILAEAVGVVEEFGQ